MLRSGPAGVITLREDGRLWCLHDNPVAKKAQQKNQRRRGLGHYAHCNWFVRRECV